MPKRWSVFLGAALGGVLVAAPVLLLGQADRSAVADEPGSPAAAAKAEPHPLDPLSLNEATAAGRVLQDQKRLTTKTRLVYLGLREPSKEEVLTWKPGSSLDRKAFAVVFDREANRTFEAIVDLGKKKIAGWKEVFGVQPALLPEETGKPVRADPRWQKAMRERGFKDQDLERMYLEVWAIPARVPPGQKNPPRLARVLSYHQGDAVNVYGRPVEGVVALINLNTRKVLEVVDRRPAVPTAADTADFFDPKTIGPLRPALKPLQTRRPKGNDFEVRGHEVRWQNWSLRCGLDPREGLGLYAVAYRDGKQTRPILYRASVSELLVSYGDPDEGWNWRNPFDEGEYGLGIGAIRLRPGLEVPEHAVLLPGVLAEDNGAVEQRRDVIAVYEQDAGILWSHTDFKTGRTETRRGRQLVLHTIFALGNYDYGTKWILGQDGTIEFQVEATGIPLVKGVADTECPLCKQKPDADGKLMAKGSDRHGELIARNLVAINHQHFFCLRLDLDVDGARNSVQEMNLMPAPVGKDNPTGNAFLVERRLLRTEREAGRDLDLASQRTWKVFNPNRKTGLGHFPGYTLQPGASAGSYAASSSALRRRAGFLDHAVWVTHSHPDERHAAGPYPGQETGGDGLPRWARANRALVNEDVVLWYTFGLTHVARPEEWPVMPVARSGFRLVPDGFFEHNPALDLP